MARQGYASIGELTPNQGGMNMKRTDYVAIMAAVIAVLLIAGCVSGPQKETSTSTSSAASATPQPQTTSTQTTYASPQPQTATSTQTTYVSPQPQTTTSTQTTKTNTEQNIVGNKSQGY
jgi:outer membrane murein-binding lipoprotein Lpp